MYFPERSTQFTGTDLAALMAGMEGPAREAFILEQVRNGCVPDFMRAPALVFLAGAGGLTARLEVCPDHLCLGTDDDFIYAQCNIATAQIIADDIGGMLPTRKIVDAIWRQAPVKIEPITQTPDKTMVTSPVFLKQSREVRAARLLDDEPLGTLTAGGFKDYILVRGMEQKPKNTCIYGWHQKNGKPIQEPNLFSHDRHYLDYSQCPRFVSIELTVGDDLQNLADVLAHPLLHVLVNDGPSKVHRVPGV